MQTVILREELSDILSEENYQEAEQALVKGDMPKDKNEILISQLIYDYIGKNADIEIGSTLDLPLNKRLFLSL